jgi:hypothetical protein
MQRSALTQTRGGSRDTAGRRRCLDPLALSVRAIPTRVHFALRSDLRARSSSVVRGTNDWSQIDFPRAIS